MRKTKRQCSKCVEIKESSATKPFVAPNYASTYICSSCGQKWWRLHGYQIWVKVANDETWRNILNGRQIPIRVGESARNWTDKQMERYLKSDEAQALIGTQ